MRTVRYTEHGGPEVLTLVEVDDWVPGPEQVLIRTEAVAGSFVDTVMRRGDGPFGPGPLPASPHGEVVGTVEVLGAGVDEAWRGRRVAVLVAADAYADVTLADVDGCAVVPDGMPAADASTLAMAGPCALIALSMGGLRSGERVLVQNAAGSIGHLAVQMAGLLGAGRVIGAVGSAAKREAVATLGADPVSLDGDWSAEVRALLPDGLDVALDSAGGEAGAAATELLAPFGRLVVYGATTGDLAAVPSWSLMASMRSVTGFAYQQWRAARPHEHRTHLATISGWLATWQLRVWTQETVALTEAARAHALLEDRARVGRVLVDPAR